MNSMQRIEAIITGKVQGVSFRYYTCREARRLGLTGWVCNERDGSVTVTAEGEKPQLEQLIQFLHVGSPEASVAAVGVQWQPAQSAFTQFEVSYRS